MTMNVTELLNNLKNSEVKTVAVVPKKLTCVCSDAGYQKHTKRDDLIVYVAKLDYQIKDWQGLNNVAKALGGKYIPKGYIAADKEATGFWFETKAQLNRFLEVHQNVEWELKATAAENKAAAAEKRFETLEKITKKATGRDEIERWINYLQSCCVAIDPKTMKDVVDTPKNKNEKQSIVLKPVIASK